MVWALTHCPVNSKIFMSNPIIEVKVLHPVQQPGSYLDRSLGLPLVGGLNPHRGGSL